MEHPRPHDETFRQAECEHRGDEPTRAPFDLPVTRIQEEWFHEARGAHEVGQVRFRDGAGGRAKCPARCELAPRDAAVMFAEIGQFVRHGTTPLSRCDAGREGLVGPTQAAAAPGIRDDTVGEDRHPRHSNR